MLLTSVRFSLEIYIHLGISSAMPPVFLIENDTHEMLKSPSISSMPRNPTLAKQSLQKSHLSLLSHPNLSKMLFKKMKLTLLLLHALQTNPLFGFSRPSHDRSPFRLAVGPADAIWDDRRGSKDAFAHRQDLRRR